MERVLVTGAGGFIGSHVAEQFVRRGNIVRAFVRYNSRGDQGLLRFLDRHIVDGIEVVTGDLREPETIRKATQGIDTVCHLAALVAIPYSYRSPLDFVLTNVMGTAHVLNAAVDAHVRRVVHTSTSEVYGTARYVPIDETHPLQAQSPYAASKIGADQLAESYMHSFELPVTIVRPFNTYGPRQSARAIIPTIIAQALAGPDIRLGSLHPTRDFTFVTDTAAAFVCMAEANGVVGRVVNFGSGKEISIGDLVQRIGRILGKELRVHGDPQRVRPRLSEVERLVANSARARELGWLPSVALEDGLRATIEWIANHQDMYRPQFYAT